MKALALEQLLQDRELRPAQIPAAEIEPGSVIYIVQLQPDERDLMESQFLAYQRAVRNGDESAKVGFRKFVFAWCLGDAENKRTLDPGTDENDVDDQFVAQMNQLAKSVPLRLLAKAVDIACQKMGLTKSDQDELVKNSAATTGGATSGSKQDTQALDE